MAKKTSVVVKFGKAEVEFKHVKVLYAEHKTYCGTVAGVPMRLFSNKDGTWSARVDMKNRGPMWTRSGRWMKSPSSAVASALRVHVTDCKIMARERDALVRERAKKLQEATEMAGLIAVRREQIERALAGITSR